MRDDAISCQRKIQMESLCFGLRLDFVYLLKIASVYKEKYTLYTDAAFCFSLHHFIYNTGSSRYELTCLIRIYKIFRHHTQHIGTAVPIYDGCIIFHIGKFSCLISDDHPARNTYFCAPAVSYIPKYLRFLPAVRHLPS